VRTGGGLVVGALGVEGPVEELYSGGVPVPRLVEQLANAAREISAGLEVGR
jgi:DNA-binding IclR family transcriptional regulator